MSSVTVTNGQFILIQSFATRKNKELYACGDPVAATVKTTNAPVYWLNWLPGQVFVADEPFGCLVSGLTAAIV